MLILDQQTELTFTLKWSLSFRIIVNNIYVLQLDLITPGFNSQTEGVCGTICVPETLGPLSVDKSFFQFEVWARPETGTVFGHMEIFRYRFKNNSYLGFLGSWVKQDGQKHPVEQWHLITASNNVFVIQNSSLVRIICHMPVFVFIMFFLWEGEGRNGWGEAQKSTVTFGCYAKESANQLTCHASAHVVPTQSPL